MEIRVLRYFLTVAQEEGINRAAEVLHITQPTLSRQLTQLEEELGVTLFHRGAKRITLTSEGILLRRRAEEILALVDRTEQEITEQEEQVEGRVVIGAGEMTAMQMMPEIIERFRERYPRVTFDLYTGTADIVKEQMEKGLVDIGVLLEPIDVQRFEFIRLHERERYVVLMRPDSPLAKKEAVSAGDLEHLPLILPLRNGIRNELLNWFGDTLHEEQVIFTSNLATNGALMVERGLTYSIVLEGSVPLIDQGRITYRPLSPELTANCVFAWKKQQPFSLAVTKFIDYMKWVLTADRSQDADEGES